MRSPLIVSYPGIPRAGDASNSVIETLDLFPTLSELAGVPPMEAVQGISLVPILNDPASPGHAAFAYTGNSQTIRTDRYRLIAHKNGHLELYDHSTSEGETQNIAEAQPELAKKLAAQLESRLQGN